MSFSININYNVWMSELAIAQIFCRFRLKDWDIINKEIILNAYYLMLQDYGANWNNYPMHNYEPNLSDYANVETYFPELIKSNYADQKI